MTNRAAWGCKEPSILRNFSFFILIAYTDAYGLFHTVQNMIYFIEKATMIRGQNACIINMSFLYAGS